MEKKQKISLVIPLYNEEESLFELHSNIVKTAKNYIYEIIFIDDGSTDKSFDNLLKLKKKDKNITIIKFKKNYGKAYALDAGFKKTKGDYIITMDADLQDDPAEIPNLIKALDDQNVDVISGWKFKRYDPITKTFPSKIFNLIIRMFTGIKLHDINCGLKIYKKDAIHNLTLYGSMHRFIPVILQPQGYKTGELKIQHHARKFGKTKYGGKRFIVGILDFFTIVFLTRFMKNPMHFFGTIGLLLILVGLAPLALILYYKIAYGNINGRYPLLNFGILSMIIGAQSFSLGLIGELLVSKSLMRIEYTIEKII